MTIWIGITFVAELLGIISAIHAIMHGRTSQGSIAWIISLITFPVFTVPAYWILGRNRFEGYVTAKQLSESEFAAQSTNLFKNLSPFRLAEGDLKGVGKAVGYLADVPFTHSNRTELLIDGEATFNSIIEGIRSATDYILFQFFIIADDELGRTLQQELIQKAASGVRILFLYDEIGSHKLPGNYLRELRSAGAQTAPFNTRKGRRNRFQINFRNHRKIVVVDGTCTWIGGHNVGDEYMGRDPKFGHWRDTHMRIDGPAALAAQMSFCVDWYWATDQRELGMNWAPKPTDDADGSVLLVPTGPADATEQASLMFLLAIHSAEERIWIASPYFVPDDAIISALQLAALRGVDVRILIPDSPDHLTVYLAAFSYHQAATETGAKIYRYTRGFMHAKTMLVDRNISAIGTANLDNRSLRLNFEITAIVNDSAFAKNVEAMYEADFQHAHLMTNNDLGNRPYWFKIAVRIARLFAPIL